MAKTWSQKEFAINTEALRSELAKRGMSLKAASLEMGHSDAYLSTKMRSGKVHETDAKILEMMFHIPRSAYEIVEPEPEKENPVEQEAPTPVVEVNIDYEQMYKTIYSAVFAAVKEAFK